jgi:protoporphyrinogen oxidase
VAGPETGRIVDDIAIIGGGPSGLAAAREAGRLGARPLVLERLDQVGGLARTISFEGSRFDIGPHRFFTKNEDVHRLFVELNGEQLLRVERMTRILFHDRYFDYPLTPVNAVFGLGLATSVSVGLSYAGARVRQLARPRVPQSFEDWVVERFGRKLFGMFFKNYTEKVWGIPCSEIGAEWAAQRIKGLSLGSAIAHALRISDRDSVKTLVDRFLFPRLGAGQTYERLADVVEQGGGTVLTGREVVRLRRQGDRVVALELADADGSVSTLEAPLYLSSAPLTELIRFFDPPAPPAVLAAARALRYRHHVAVDLEVEGNPFPDNWIYVHSPEFRLARIANYRNFSPDMASAPDRSPLTVEYFSFPGDGIWEAPDGELVALATRELREMKLLEPDAVLRSLVVRSERAYPVIERGYEHHIDTIRGWLAGLANLLPIGRSGMFKYNNQDHAIATGVLAARTILGEGDFDPWLVNIDADYQESAPAR